MIESILVGTDGSDSAAAAVARAIEVAHGLGARLQIVSAYEPVPEGRLRQAAMPVPDDQAWTVNPRGDVLALLESAERDAATPASSRWRRSPASATAPTRSSTWPRSSAAT